MDCPLSLIVTCNYFYYAYLFNRRSLFLHSIQHITPILNEIASGLAIYHFNTVLKDQLDLFKYVFCPSELFRWDYETFLNSLVPDFDDDGSNRKNKETITYKAFLDFVQMCFHDGKYCKTALQSTAVSFYCFFGEWGVEVWTLHLKGSLFNVLLLIMEEVIKHVSLSMMFGCLNENEAFESLLQYS